MMAANDEQGSDEEKYATYPRPVRNAVARKDDSGSDVLKFVALFLSLNALGFVFQVNLSLWYLAALGMTVVPFLFAYYVGVTKPAGDRTARIMGWTAVTLSFLYLLGNIGTATAMAVPLALVCVVLGLAIALWPYQEARRKRTN